MSDATHRTVIFRNTVKGSPAKARCVKDGVGPYTFSTTGLNISVDSLVDRWGDTAPASSVNLDLCH